MSDLRIEFTYPWLLLLLIPALFCTLFPHFRTAKKFRRSRNRIISVVMHTVAMTLCILLLAGMTFSYQVPNKENELMILVDVSSSSEEQANQKNEFIQTVIDACDSRYRVGIVTFGFNPVYAAPLSDNTREVYGQYLASNSPDKSATDIAAALNFAAGQFSNPKTAKIVVLSDGFETDESALSAVSAIAAQGIKVDTVHFAGTEEKEEIQILHVEFLEETIVVGQPVKLRVTMQSNYEEETAVDLIVTEQNFDRKYPFRIEGGIQTVELEYTFDKAGLHELYFSVSSDVDAKKENNQICTYLHIPVLENILILERIPNESASLVDILSGSFNTTVVNIRDHADDVPRNVKELSAYEQVILVNISNQDLTNAEMPEGFDQVLYDYVYNLGGSLLTVGGEKDVDANGVRTPHAYNRKDMAGTLFQQMLPVQAIDYSPPIAVMLVIDCSGSMSMGRFEAALSGAEECLNAMSERDYCGVMSFSTSADEEIAVLPVSQREQIRTAIRNLHDTSGSGGTVFSSAIDKAGRALAAIPVERRHIILVTDGNPSDHLEQYNASDTNYYGKYIDYNYEQSGITMSVITVGMGGSKSQMEETAERGHGNYYDVPRDGADGIVGVYMSQDLKAIEIAEMEEGTEFVPQIKDITPALIGINSSTDIPPLKGYYGTKVKDEAKVPLNHEYAPIFAHWQFGEGYVGSFMSDLSGDWSNDFVKDNVGRMLIQNMVYCLAPTHTLEADQLEIILRPQAGNYLNRLDVYANCGENETVSVSVRPLSSRAITYYNGSVPVTAAGDNVRFDFEINQSGLYQILVEKKDANGNILADLAVYQTFSYSAEYNSFHEEGEGAALLTELAGNGRGDVLTDPIDIFESFVRSFPKTTDPRLVFLIVAIVCMLVDIAVRKFKFKWPHEIIRDRKKLKDLNAGGGKH